MSTIYTLTLNPVIDVHFAMGGIVRGQENYTRHRIRTAAGKGVNVSAALKRHGVTAPAFVLAGDNGAADYMRMLEAAGIEAVAHTVPGNMREYISLNDASDGSETRICYRDFKAGDNDVLTLGEKLAARLCEGDIVCISGALPEGVRQSAVVRLSKTFSKRGARVVIDSASMSLGALQEASPWLIKPNLEEAKNLLRASVNSYFDYMYVPVTTNIDEYSPGLLAAMLTGYMPNVLLSLGPDGAIFHSRQANLSQPAVPVEHCYSTVGAGDNLLAGFLFGLSEADKSVDGDGEGGGAIRGESGSGSSAGSGGADVCESDGAIGFVSARYALKKAVEFAAEICGMER